jgi:transglutaminase-like putative cysteine protease
MRRTVTASMRLRFRGDTRAVLSIAAALPAQIADERLVLRHQHGELNARELVDGHGTRLHLLEAGEGWLQVEYSAEVIGRTDPAPTDELDLIRFMRPSRYAESDALGPTARSEFSGLTGLVLLDAVTDWVGSRLAYVSGSSLPTDGAARTLLNRQGVCRDFAHLTIALLRALDVPARMVSVYAPGLSPMDFHAVVEANVDGMWHVVDATRLAPRQSLLRIATGRDAADTAFLTTHDAEVEFQSLEVSAVVDVFPFDEIHLPAQLG